jgi:hypothetical protein
MLALIVFPSKLDQICGRNRVFPISAFFMSSDLLSITSNLSKLFVDEFSRWIGLPDGFFVWFPNRSRMILKIFVHFLTRIASFVSIFVNFLNYL